MGSHSRTLEGSPKPPVKVQTFKLAPAGKEKAAIEELRKVSSHRGTASAKVQKWEKTAY